jgi:glycosyltransferase involved in cell wall biosynthesis
MGILSMKIAAMLRVKNEERWIGRVLRSIYRLCERVVILDDHSTDNTVGECYRVSDEVNRDFQRCGITVTSSPFSDLNETRDKNFLYGLTLSLAKPDWVLCIDGDEELEPGGYHKLQALTLNTAHNCYSLRVLYLWDDPYIVRMDGVYARFHRPSFFKALPGLQFQSTSYGGNFHCGNVPKQLLWNHAKADVNLLHYGYMDAKTRKAKFEFYNRVDPGNRAEDGYRHITQGDPGGADANERLLHAGPLQLVPLSSLTTT